MLAEQFSCQRKRCGGQKTKIILTHGGRQRRVADGEMPVEDEAFQEKDGGRDTDQALKDAGPRAPEGVTRSTWRSRSAREREGGEDHERKLRSKERKKKGHEAEEYLLTGVRPRAQGKVTEDLTPGNVLIGS